MNDVSTLRQPQGQPTGGQFAAHPHSESDANLADYTAAISADRFKRLRTSFWQAEQELISAGDEAATDAAAAKYPGAAQLSVEWVDESFDSSSHLALRSISTADGETFDADEDEDLREAIDEYLSVYSTWDDVENHLPRDRDSDSETEFFIDVPAPARPEDFNVRSARHASDMLAERRRAIDEAEYRLAHHSCSQLALAKFPTAATLVLTDENDGPGSAYWVPVAIVDAEGTELWTSEDDEDGFDDQLAEWTPALDRIDHGVIEGGGLPHIELGR